MKQKYSLATNGSWLCLVAEKQYLIFKLKQNMSSTKPTLNEAENGNKSKPLLAVVYSDEILSIDSKIKSCLVENPGEESSEYYAKIWFAYKMNNGNPQPDGRQEFVTDTKEELISEIKEFMKSDKICWCIL